MPKSKRKLTWQEELEIIDRTMHAISGITDPEELIETYWEGVGGFVPTDDYVALSRRGVPSPDFLITRSSRFTEHYNPWTERQKLPRLRGGLLGEIVYAGKPVIIEDLPSRLAPDDPAHFHLQGYRFLVAMPQYDNGEALNFNVMLGTEPEDLELERLPMLHWQSGLFGRGTQNLVLRNELSHALRALDREMQIVGEIQRSLLPIHSPQIPGIEIGTDYQTSARAGGDYYDFFPLDQGRWGVFLADVSGHGTPAAVLMAITRAIIHSRPQLHAAPGELLAFLNAELARSYTRGGTFVTAYAAVVDPHARSIVHASAGHCPPRLHRESDVLSLTQATALPLGIVEDQRYEESRVALEKRDTLLLYTDGISEAMSPRSLDGRRALFGVDRMDNVLRSHAPRGASACITGINAALGEFCMGEPATDDRTLIAMSFL